MFLTKDDLKLSYGVDLQIGKTMIERSVPTDNLYWKNRKIYIPGAPGYMFIPIYADMLRRSGVLLTELLSDAFIQISEKYCTAQHCTNMNKLLGRNMQCRYQNLFVRML